MNKKYSKISFLGFYLIISLKLFSQNTIEIIYKGELLDGPDGIIVDKAGNLFIANWGREGKGSTVIKVDKANVTSNYITNLKSPDGLAFHKRTLYVSNFASGEITKWKKNKLTPFVKINGNPAGLAFDKNNNLYVADFGNWTGKTIYRISRHGNISIFADSLEVPLGLLFDDCGNLFISCFASGNIYKITADGKKSIFTSIPNKPIAMIQYLAFDKDSNLLVPSYGHNCIYKINSRGTVTKLDKFSNKQTNEAYQLSGPNSIINRNGEIFITEFNKNSLLKIDLNE